MDEKEIYVETFIPEQYEASSSKKRFRPVEGQGLDTSMRVEYDKSIRDKYPVGTKFKIKARVTDREGTEFLYSFHGWDPIEIIEPNDN